MRCSHGMNYLWSPDTGDNPGIPANWLQFHSQTWSNLFLFLCTYCFQQVATLAAVPSSYVRALGKIGVSKRSGRRIKKNKHFLACSIKVRLVRRLKWLEFVWISGKCPNFIHNLGIQIDSFTNCLAFISTLIIPLHLLTILS